MAEEGGACGGGDKEDHWKGCFWGGVGPGSGGMNGLRVMIWQLSDASLAFSIHHWVMGPTFLHHMPLFPVHAHT